MSSPVYHSYTFAGHREYCLSFGGGCDRRILVIPPLFDEMNRMRRVLACAMRDLATRGVGSALIDLPGCNESLAALPEQSLQTWREAVTACAGQWGATHIAAFRGGALVDDGVRKLPHWRLAAAKGNSLLRTMIRTRLAGEKESGVSLSEEQLLSAAKNGPIELGGNLLGSAMVAQLGIAEPVALSTLTEKKLGEDIVGAPLWLRAEPQDDPEFAASIASSLDAWSAACGG